MFVKLKAFNGDPKDFLDWSYGIPTNDWAKLAGQVVKVWAENDGRGNVQIVRGQGITAWILGPHMFDPVVGRIEFVNEDEE